MTLRSHLTSLLRRLRRLCRLRNSAPKGPRRRPARPDDDRDDLPLGCGWFDSSYELSSGLVVQEHAAAEALVAGLPAGVWLELALRTPRGMAAA